MDIVEKLRITKTMSQFESLSELYAVLNTDRLEAADEIERLRNECQTAWNSAIAERDLYAKAQNEIESLRRRLQDGSPVVEGTIQHMAMEIAALKRERDELADAFTVLWVSQDNHERNHWDIKAIEKFDALLAKVGADKVEV